ncbi:single-stranded DNA-binding protein [Mycoplasmoides pirum]|uniref:single-stranded DNA-binding protein n=1 Tax=Mycoplasmoides pirum TaxID=2122 RepID=UPI00047FBA78|nr:single-stranded DNA-binding protein [Mycoplasmoides pirum]
MNRVTLAGYLAQDPTPLNSSSKNDFVGVRFTVAVKDLRDRNIGETHFLNCVAWSNTASYIQKNLKRGDFIVGDGRIRMNKFVNSEGKNISRTEIVIDTVAAPGSRRNSNNVTQQITTTELENIDNAFPDTIDIDLNLDEAFSVKEVDKEDTNNPKENKENTLPWSDDLED